MPSKGTIRRSVRVPDDEWLAALNAAAALKTDISTEVRRALRQLVRRAARTERLSEEDQ